MAMQLSFSQFSEGVQSQGGASCSQRLTCAFSSGCRLDTPHVPPHLDLSLTDSEGQEPLRDATNMFDAPPLSQMPSQLASQQFLSTQDFVTPVDPPANGQPRQSFRTPAQISPARLKRPRPISEMDTDGDMELSQSQPTAMGPPGARLPPTAHKAKAHRVGPHARERSPPCLRNVFVDSAIDEDSGYNASIASLPHTQREPPARYRAEFKELRGLGQGNFSIVRAAKHRLDGIEYAIKRSANEITDKALKAQWIQEIHAWARLSGHPNVVRYYSSWFEKGGRGEHAFIQLEKCGMKLSEHAQLTGPLREADLVNILGQLAAALQHVHAHGMVHMDVKPDNVYACEDGVFKLGDFGLATQAKGTDDVRAASGDARYVAREVVADDYRNLDKADMFSLGASMYELAKGEPLPTGGPAFESLREGKIFLVSHTVSFQNMLKRLVHPEPCQRPAPREVVAWVKKQQRQEAAAAAEGKRGSDNSRAAGSRSQLSLQPSQASAAAAG